MTDTTQYIENLDLVNVKIIVKNLEFSDGTKLDIGAADIVVFVGPNNAGKSAALREIEGAFVESPKKVLKEVNLETFGTLSDMKSFINSVSRQEFSGNNINYVGFGFSISDQHLNIFWPNNLTLLKPLFLTRLATESRITQSDAVASINALEDSPNHPIHLLMADDSLEKRISGYFRRAFGNDLIVFRGGGSQAFLLVGQTIKPVSGEDRISTSYLKRLVAETVPLQKQGDGMRSFASIILHLLAPSTPSILLLDEPEAFLHPPQARLIGEFIAKERAGESQLFLATHSPDVLLGLLSAAPKSLRVVRLQRDGVVNRAKELDQAKALAISADPLMKFSGVISGIFHHRVFITESDADAMFYEAILDLPSVHGEVSPDALFVQAGGKDRMAPLAEALKSLDVNVDVIADIDVLNDEAKFKRLVVALGGDWLIAEPDAKALKKAIEQHKPWLNATEVVNGISTILEKAPGGGEFPKALKSEIDSIFRKANPWDAIKEAGVAAIPSGQPTTHWNKLTKYCESLGLWIVPVGELEGFCKSIGGHGPRWTQDVLGERDIASDNDLSSARDFVKKVWGRVSVC